MRFLSIFKSVETNAPPSPELMARMGALIERSMASGELVATEGCFPSALGARVRRDGGRVTVVDGPFTESKELVAGYTLIQTRTRDAAIEWSRRFPNPIREGESCHIEVRQLYDLEDFDGMLSEKTADRFRDMGMQ